MEWWGWVVSVLGAIILLSNGIKAIRELLTPATAIAEKVEKLDRSQWRCVSYCPEQDCQSW